MRKEGAGNCGAGKGNKAGSRAASSETVMLCDPGLIQTLGGSAQFTNEQPS